MADGGNNALQAWDLLHGHLRLGGWQIGDANYYFLELPLIALSEAIFGIGETAEHVASSLTYMLVAAVAVAAAVSDSRGAARPARALVALAVMGAPLFGGIVFLMLEEPDHVGTGVFIIGAFLLIDRLPKRRFTAPLLLVLLCAGQFEDLMVLYFAVPAIAVVCGYRALAARSLRSRDAMFALMAVLSFPLTSLITMVWVHLGGFTTAANRGSVSPVHEWPQHIANVWVNILELYGASPAPGVVPGARAYFGYACVLAAVAGFCLVLWRWRRASRAEQFAVAAIVFNFGLDAVTSFAYRGNPHELAAVLPCGALLASRALVPARIRSTTLAIAAVTAAAVVAVVPLAVAAVRPVHQSPKDPLVATLESHGLTYGLAIYDDGSTATVLSRNKVQLETLNVGATSLGRSHYEVKEDWYFPSLYYADYVVADPAQRLPPSVVILYFGEPTTTYKVGHLTIMVYKKNLLRLLSES
jgi:hypothetical protein